MDDYYDHDEDEEQDNIIHVPTEVAAALADFIRRQPDGRFLPGALK